MFSRFLYMLCHYNLKIKKALSGSAVCLPLPLLCSHGSGLQVLWVTGHTENISIFLFDIPQISLFGNTYTLSTYAKMLLCKRHYICARN